MSVISKCSLRCLTSVCAAGSWNLKPGFVVKPGTTKKIGSMGFSNVTLNYTTASFYNDAETVHDMNPCAAHVSAGFCCGGSCKPCES